MTESEMIYQELVQLPYYEDLLEVGTSKLVGYLPVETIKESDPDGVVKLTRWATLKGLNHCLELFGNVRSGAMYIWDAVALDSFLARYADVFLAAGIPTTHDRYISHIEREVVDSTKFPEAYILVGQSFNDARFQGSDSRGIAG